MVLIRIHDNGNAAGGTRRKHVTNMTAIGKIDSFDEIQEKWETYVERVEQFY